MRFILQFVCSIGTLGMILLPTSASARAPAPVQITLLPVETINLSADEAPIYGRLLRGVLKQSYRVKLKEAPELAASLKGQEPSCRAEVNCLRKICAGKPVQKLLALRVGRLSDTLVIRLAVFDIPRGVLQGTWQEVLNQSDQKAVTRALERMVLGFIPQRPVARPWYAKWWVWTVAGAVVAGSVTAAILASQSSEPVPDVTIELP